MTRGRAKVGCLLWDKRWPGRGAVERVFVAEGEEVEETGKRLRQNCTGIEAALVEGRKRLRRGGWVLMLR